MTKKKKNNMVSSESKAKINNLNSHFAELRKRIVFSLIICFTSFLVIPGFIEL